MSHHYFENKDGQNVGSLKKKCKRYARNGSVFKDSIKRLGFARIVIFFFLNILNLKYIK